MEPPLPLVVVLAASTALAGCVGGLAQGSASPGDADLTRPTWEPGRWWSYDVNLHGDRTLRVTLVVDDAGADGYRLGSNRTEGFLGLPFDGNLTPALNPTIAGERWTMLRFPLEPGGAWEQELFGHTVRTEVEAAQVAGPDGTREDGVRLEATTYGSRLATYTYVPSTKWLGSFTLRDPGTGETVLDARLTAAGDDHDRDYYVKRSLGSLQVTYPDDHPLGERSLHVDEDGRRLVASLVVDGDAGDFEAVLRDPGGEVVASASVRGSGLATDQASVPVMAGDWTLHHRGVGAGTAHLILHVLERVDPTPRDDDGGDGDGGTDPGDPVARAPTVDLADLVAASTP